MHVHIYVKSNISNNNNKNYAVNKKSTKQISYKNKKKVRQPPSVTVAVTVGVAVTAAAIDRMSLPMLLPLPL